MTEKPPVVESSTVDDLVERTKAFLAGIAFDYLKRPLDELLTWVLRRTIWHLIALALFIAAIVFLLLGGVQGLEAAGLPSYLAHLSLGVAAVIAGLIALRLSGGDSRP
jgi:hypothetical protein